METKHLSNGWQSYPLEGWAPDVSASPLHRHTIHTEPTSPSCGSIASHRADETPEFSMIAQGEPEHGGSCKSTWSWQVSRAEVPGKWQGGGAAAAHLSFWQSNFLVTSETLLKTSAQLTLTTSNHRAFQRSLWDKRPSWLWLRLSNPASTPL